MAKPKMRFKSHSHYLEWESFGGNFLRNEMKFSEAFAVIEANDSEKNRCWADWSEDATVTPKKPVKWEQQLIVHMIHVGTFGKMPINMSVTFAKIDGRVVVFWYGCSMVTHSQMYDDFIEMVAPNAIRKKADSFYHVAYTIGVKNKEDGITPTA